MFLEDLDFCPLVIGLYTYSQVFATEPNILLI